MARRRMLFRSSPSTMIEIFSSTRFRALATIGSIAFASTAAAAQQPGDTPPPGPADQPGAVIPLSLGDAARLAARQSALALGARLRADEAQARVRERRADLLPNLSSYVQEAG